MAINQAVCATFKQQLLDGDHDISSDTVNLALYTSSATLDANTTAFSATNEVGNSGTYVSGGATLQNANVSLTKTNATASTAFVDFDDLSFTGVTLTARGALIYNTSNSNKAVAVLDFGGDKTATAGTFTIQFPNANDTQAIIRIA